MAWVCARLSPKGSHVGFIGVGSIQNCWICTRLGIVAHTQREFAHLDKRQRCSRIGTALALVEMQERVGTGQSVPLRVQIAQLIEVEQLEST
eukprot:3376462-Amphidinium_carterae.2